jgi:hypothetical protein
MREREEARDAKRAFIDALTDLQNELPPIGKDGLIKDRAGAIRSRYALIEDIDEILKPLMAKYGFSFSFSVASITNGMREYHGTLLHRAGHERTLSVFLPLDSNGSRSAVQSEGSTNSYAKRQLYKLHFNFTERGVDDDGSGQGLDLISNDEALDLHAKLEEIRADVPKFLKYFEIEKLEDLRKSQLSNAYDMIAQKAKKK